MILLYSRKRRNVAQNGAQNRGQGRSEDRAQNQTQDNCVTYVFRPGNDSNMANATVESVPSTSTTTSVSGTSQMSVRPKVKKLAPANRKALSPTDSKNMKSKRFFTSAPVSKVTANPPRNANKTETKATASVKSASKKPVRVNPFNNMKPDEPTTTKLNSIKTTVVDFFKSSVSNSASVKRFTALPLRSLHKQSSANCDVPLHTKKSCEILSKSTKPSSSESTDTSSTNSAADPPREPFSRNFDASGSTPSGPTTPAPPFNSPKTPTKMGARKELPSVVIVNENFRIPEFKARNTSKASPVTENLAMTSSESSINEESFVSAQPNSEIEAYPEDVSIPDEAIASSQDQTSEKVNGTNAQSQEVAKNSADSSPQSENSLDGNDPKQPNPPISPASSFEIINSADKSSDFDQLSGSTSSSFSLCEVLDEDLNPIAQLKQK